MRMTLQQILTIARTGSPARAWSAFVESGWDAVLDNPKALTLKGRLLKDQAKAAAPSARNALFTAAAKAYGDAATLHLDSYPLINAAFLALMGGDEHHAAKLAAQTLTLIDDDPSEGENAYWRRATRAEALLLLGREDEARAELSDAIAQLPDAWEDHAATIGQFTLILNKLARSSRWLDAHRPPPSVHFSGIIRLDDTHGDAQEAIKDYIATHRPGFAYGALAAGADILFAKAFLAHKAAHNDAAQLHIILPYPTNEFRALSVAPFGAEWLADFDDILAQAESVTILGCDEPPDDLAIALADEMAMGMAMRNAANLQSSALAVTIAAKDEPLRPHLDLWQSQAQSFTIILGKRRKTGIAMRGADSINSNKSIGTLVWIKHDDAAQLRAVINDRAELNSNGDDHWFAADQLQAAWHISGEIMHHLAGNCRMALLHNIIDLSAPCPDMLKRAHAYAQAAAPHMIYTDDIGAMAITRAALSEKVEEIGALRSIWGPQPLWRVMH